MRTFTERVLVLVLEFTWLSFCAGTDHCKVNVEQLQFMEAYTEASNVTILCTFSAEKCTTSSPKILWFRYLAQTHEDLCTPECKNSGKFEVIHLKNQTWLQITTPSVEDSGVYYCGIAFPDSNSRLSKKTGIGTMLVIRETKQYSQEVNNTMVAISLLLFFYLMTILAISKFFSKPKFKKPGNEDLRGKHSIGDKGSREAVCHAIAKEAYKKKHNKKRWPVSSQQHLNGRNWVYTVVWLTSAKETNHPSQSFLCQGLHSWGCDPGDEYLEEKYLYKNCYWPAKYFAHRLHLQY